MRAPRIAEDFVPVSEFKAHAAEWLHKAADTGVPVVVTQNGKPAGVVLSPKVFDELTERARFLEAVEQGLTDANAGHVLAHSVVASRIRARFGGRRK